MKFIQSLKAAVFAGRTFRAGRSTWRSEREAFSAEDEDAADTGRNREATATTLGLTAEASRPL